MKKLSFNVCLWLVPVLFSGQLWAQPQNGSGRTLPVVLKTLQQKMVFMGGGTFVMGAVGDEEAVAQQAEKPAHEVELSSFSISKYEVTQAEWVAVMGENPSHFKGDDLPVENVSWEDCQEFIQRLNQMTGQNFRLPTEAEWEYAARGGVFARNTIPRNKQIRSTMAWGANNSRNTTHKVGSKMPNELGFFDMVGNVAEWCSDWYAADYYSLSPKKDPLGPSVGSLKVVRGGSFCFGRCDEAERGYFSPQGRYRNVGFRLALESLTVATVREDKRGEGTTIDPLESRVFSVVEEQPRFPGGDAALMTFLRNNLRYPSSARENHIQGTVLAQFVVLADGSVGDVEILKSLSPDCDAEVRRLIKTLPKFEPGKQNGQPVKVKYRLPVRFSL